LKYQETHALQYIKLHFSDEVYSEIMNIYFDKSYAFVI